MNRLLADDWRERLGADFARGPLAFVAGERRAGRVVFPADGDMFRALELTPFHRVKVVILGQDPYHGAGQAHGLAFSVPRGAPLPPSLRNIYKELATDLDIPAPSDGHLERWARQGVLLLNATLSVEEGRAGSHQGRGWEAATDRIVSLLDVRPGPMAFLLWGSHAQKKAAVVDRARHLVLEAPHPSPLSAHRGFFGCRHFSMTNAWLRERGYEAIDWR
jgi:uracil-DNA glycosylase